MAGQRSFSLAFNPDKEADLISLIEDSPSRVVKDALEFYIKYRHLIPELDNTSDLLSIVAQMAVKQQEMIVTIAGLSDKLLNGVQAVSVAESFEEGYDDMMEFE